MGSYTLSGSGVQALSTNVTALHIAIATLGSPAGLGKANPSSYYDVGLLRFGDGVGFWDPLPIHGGPQWMGVPYGTTQLGYALLGGSVITVTEVIGGTSPFGAPFPSLEQLADVGVASPTDGQVLEWIAAAGQWQNRSPAGGFTGLTSSSSVLGADVSFGTPGTYKDAVTLALAAGTWLLLAQISMIASSGVALLAARLYDGTNPVAAAQTESNGANIPAQLVLGALVAPTSLTTYHLQGNINTGGGTGNMKAALASGLSDTHATQLLAVKID